MQTRALIATVALLLAIGACKKKSARSESAPTSAAIEASRASLAQTDDEGAAVYLTIWPKHWDKRQTALTSTLASLPPAFLPPHITEAVQQFVNSELPDPWSLLEMTASKLMQIELPARPKSLDATRPIHITAMATLGRAEQVGVDLAAHLQGSLAEAAEKLQPFGLRHRVQLPATDADALASSLRAAMASNSALTALADDPTTRRSNTRLVRIRAEGPWVFVDIVTGDALHRLDAAGRSEFLGAPLKSLASPHPLVRSQAPSIGRLHLRMDRFANASAMLGMLQVVGALTSYEGEHRKLLLSAGMSEILTSYLVMDPGHDLFSDAVLDVGAGDEPMLRAFLVASETGARLLETDATLASGKPAALSSIEWGALVARTPLPQHFAIQDSQILSPQDLVHECGYSCTVWAALGNGLIMARLVREASPESFNEFMSKKGELPPVNATWANRVLAVTPKTNTLDVAAHTALVETRSPPAITRESECLARAVLKVKMGLGSVSEASPDQRGLILARALAESAPDLMCAEAATNLRPRAAVLRQLLVSIGEIAASSHQGAAEAR